ncbi:hypothetical protein E2P81_ATG10559 [Venturia nashicola]|nr:hypothetical protein E2P81_ATG10559 [Venturia nashicola]
MEGTYVRTDSRQTARHSIARQHIHKAKSGADEQELQAEDDLLATASLDLQLTCALRGVKSAFLLHPIAPGLRSQCRDPPAAQQRQPFSIPPTADGLQPQCCGPH